jgi:lipid-A-disaccharide synthase
MRYYIVAGEASGDLHGSNLIKQVHQLDKDTDIRCWGGELMETAGATLVKHYRELAFMGFAEVIKNLPTIFKNIAFCKKDIAAFNPDVLVLIDYPGFNLRIAEWAHEQGFKVVYYISPQVWAWKENRVKKMKQCIDQMIVILPFEQEWYASKWQWQVAYAGHPLVTVIDNYQPVSGKLGARPVVAVLPGSRKQEISVKLPVMLRVRKDIRPVETGDSGYCYQWNRYVGNCPFWGATSSMLQGKQHQLSNSKKADQDQIHFTGEPDNGQTRSERVDTT